MAETQKNPMIYAAIANVIADVGAVKKDKVNKVQNFKFRSVDDVFNAIHPALAKNKVFIVPLIIDQKREIVGVTKNGNKMTLVICKIKFTFYAEDGSHVESIIIGEGLDTGDKATNKAMAIAYKYACFQVFCIPTEDMIDPDSERPELQDEKMTSVETNNQAKNKAAGEKKAAKSKKTSEQNADNNSNGEADARNQKITDAMLATIHKEQERTGVKDAQILGRRSIHAKKIEDMTINEFKIVMKIFEATPDMTQKEESVNE